MAEAESKRPDGIQCVSIITPNNTHAAISTAFLSKGIHVICDKPMTTSLADAVTVLKLSEQTGLVFALTQNYSAYPMVVEARHLVRTGAIGNLRLVYAEYAQGTRNRLVEAEGDDKMAWRVDTKIGGPSTVLGDLGTHAHHLLRFITGLEIESLSADLMTIVPGRVADDNAYVSLRMQQGVRALFWSSMVATGNGHGLRIRVFGDKASLHWDHEAPNELRMGLEGEPYRTLRRGEPYLSEDTKRATRVKIGQPEGYIEAFGNVYAEAAMAIRDAIAGKHKERSTCFFASAREGAIAMKFIEACVASSTQNGAWVDATVDF
jgi:predicted dehydrogenase